VQFPRQWTLEEQFGRRRALAGFFSKFPVGFGLAYGDPSSLARFFSLPFEATSAMRAADR